MNSILFAVCIICITAGIFVLYFLISIGRRWHEARWLKQYGTEAQGRILETKVIDEASRYLPFVWLKVEISPEGKSSFVTEVKTLFPSTSIQELIEGHNIRLKYNPRDVSQVQLIKGDQGLKKKENNWQLSNPQLSLAR